MRARAGAEPHTVRCTRRQQPGCPEDTGQGALGREQLGASARPSSAPHGASSGLTCPKAPQGHNNPVGYAISLLCGNINRGTELWGSRDCNLAL